MSASAPFPAFDEHAAGARFHRVDLHIHSFGGSLDVEDKSMTPGAIVQKARERGIGVIALADHNSVDNVESLLEAAGKTGGEVVAIPGVEITTSQGHVLVLCASQALSELNALLARLDFREGDAGDRYTRVPIDQIAEQASRSGAITIPAHVGREGTGFLARAPHQDRLAVFESPHVHALEFDRPEHVAWFTLEDRDDGREQRREYLKRRRAALCDSPASSEFGRVLFSDAHELGAVGCTRDGQEKLTLVKMDRPSFEGLAAAFRDPDARVVGGGYIGATVGNSETEAINDSCAALSSCIGPKLLKPIAARLRTNGIERICLIPMGIMGLLPLHALDWSNGTTRECLLDRFEITFASSAAIRAVCGHRAADLGDLVRRLVVVGNPLPHSVPLPGARYEAEMVERTMDAADSTLLLGEAATKDAAIEALPGASHVHLACHGAGAFFGDTLTAGLSLAHEEVISASEILDLDAFEPRLVVASACETGVVQSYNAAGEALSMAGVMLGAGAACTIATLWSVDDWTTAVLMSRLYELISGSNDIAPVPPAAALRRAQLWLRTLTPDRESSYVTARPALLDHRAGRNLTATDPSTGSCYASTASWAAFVASGA